VLTQRLPLLEADVVCLERDVLGVVHGSLAPAVVVVVVAAGLVAGGHLVGVGWRHVAGGVRQVRVWVLLVVVEEGLDGGVGVPRCGHARDGLGLVRDLGSAVEAHQQASHQAQRSHLNTIKRRRMSVDLTQQTRKLPAYVLTS
jgi:hypothetical protein